MASLDHAHAAEGHDDGAVHAHVSPVIFYVGIFLALVFFTILTVGQSYVDLGRLNIILIILIASCKAALVVTFFMHLKWDNKFHALIFVSTIFFIGVFFAYTLNDTDRRGDYDADQNVKVLPKTGQDAPGGFEPPAAPAGHEGGEHAPAGGGAAPAEHH